MAIYELRVSIKEKQAAKIYIYIYKYISRIGFTYRKHLIIRGDKRSN